MTAFWISAAALAAVALALVLRPLWLHRGGGASRRELNLSVYRDQLRELDGDLHAGTLAQADYERARAELERRLLEDVQGVPPEPTVAAPRRRWPALAAAIGVPVLALGVYFAIGNPRALDPREREAGNPAMHQLEDMIQKLADRLAQNPDDVQGWKMLGRSYTVTQRFAEASKAYSKAAALAPRDPQLLADLADALAMARGQSMQGEPDELVQRALQIDPKNLKALALAGTSAYDRKDYAGAAAYWERMLPLVESGSEDARSIQANVDEARKLALSAPQAPAKAAEARKAPEKKLAEQKAPEKKEPAKATAALQGTVSLSPKLAGKAKPDDTVFIFARAAEGPPMPLAVARMAVRDLPATFTLDDSMSMSPAATLSGTPRVVVAARVAKSGNASAQPGDLQGLSAPVSNSARGVNIVIDSEVPQKK